MLSADTNKSFLRRLNGESTVVALDVVGLQVQGVLLDVRSR